MTSKEAIKLFFLFAGTGTIAGLILVAGSIWGCTI